MIPQKTREKRKTSKFFPSTKIIESTLPELGDGGAGAGGQGDPEPRDLLQGGRDHDHHPVTFTGLYSFFFRLGYRSGWK